MHRSLLIIAFLIAAVIQGCALGDKSSPCPQVPEGFDAKSLVGQWEATYAAGAKDTLTIRADGTYSQRFSDPASGIKFSIEDRGWRLEPGENGLFYLHLENMRRCDRISDICDLEDGGGGDSFWWDFCADDTVRMVAEVKLLVTGPGRGAPPDQKLWLWHLSADPDSGAFHFERESPDS